MKKEYLKPEAELISFRATESIATIEDEDADITVESGIEF